MRKGRSKRQLTPEADGEPGIKKAKVTRMRLEGQARVEKKIAKNADLDKELNKKINPFQNPKVDRPISVQKLPKGTRAAGKKGADKIAILRATPPRTGIQLVEEVDQKKEKSMRIQLILFKILRTKWMARRTRNNIQTNSLELKC